MSSISNKRRRPEEDVRRPKKKIRVRKQAEYHSSSEDNESEDGAELAIKQQPKSILKLPVRKHEDGEESESEFEGLDDLDEAERNTALNAIRGNEEDEDVEDIEEEVGLQDQDDNDEQLEKDDEDEEDQDSDSQSETSSLTSSTAARLKKKRNDPSAFATSISKILDTKLSTTKRSDPVLSRSKTADSANKSLADSKLETAARAQMRSEKKAALQKGRVMDVLGLEDEGVDTGKVQEEERALKKVAQRGVVKLFNAVRAAQVKGEEARKESSAGGVVGAKQREERVSEMSKEGFLEMISRGQKAAPAAV